MEMLHPTRAGNKCVACGTSKKLNTVNQDLVTVTFSTALPLEYLEAEFYNLNVPTFFK